MRQNIYMSTPLVLSLVGKNTKSVLSDVFRYIWISLQITTSQIFKGLYSQINYCSSIPNTMLTISEAIVWYICMIKRVGETTKTTTKRKILNLTEKENMITRPQEEWTTPVRINWVIEGSDSTRTFTMTVTIKDNLQHGMDQLSIPRNVYITQL